MSNIEEIVGRSGGNVAPSSDPSSIQRLDELSTKVDRMEAMLVRIEELVTKTPAPTGEDDEYCKVSEFSGTNTNNLKAPLITIMKSGGKIVYKTVSSGPRSDCCTFYLRIYAKLCGRLANVLSIMLSQLTSADRPHNFV